MLQLNMININKYQNIGGTILDNQVYPEYFKPSPSIKDYSKGYIYRYFVQKINNLTITEVDKDKYNQISSQLYNKLTIRWTITGSKENVYNNKILERIGVKEQNIKTLSNGNSKMRGLKNYITNPLEFWAGK